MVDDASDCVCHPEDRTGGDHAMTCPEYEPDCTCYEMFGTGHQSMCPAGHWLRSRHAFDNPPKTGDR